MVEVRFLELHEIMAVHDDLVNRFGGSLGLRDESLLDAAINFPQASFLGNYLHHDLFAMAAAYALSIIKNHAFIDGNKRTGITVAVLFLLSNGIELDLTQDQYFELAVGIATSQLELQEIADAFRKATKSK